ncbi:MAG: MFS transporter [Alphaproteobacteria bacterium]
MGFLKSAGAFLLAVFILRAALGAMFQAPGAAGPALVEAFALDWAGFGTLVGLFWLPGLFLAYPLGLLARRLGDRRGVLLGLLLLILGALVSARADVVALLVAGRLLMGLGTLLVILLLTKMVQDRFTGRDLFPAMAVYVLGWPLGIAAAQAALPGFVPDHGWQFPYLVAAFAGSLALVAIALARGPEPRIVPICASTSSALTRAEFRRMCIAGACWALVNGAYMVLVSFAPPMLMARGLGLAEASFATSLISWSNLLAVPAGAWLARRAGVAGPMTISATLLAMLAGFALPIADVAWAPSLGLLHGLCYALPITIFSALAAEAVAPERRARGLGVYFVWFYAGCTGCPAFAGWLRDVTGDATAPVFFAVAALGGALGLYVWFRRDLVRG